MIPHPRVAADDVERDEQVVRAAMNEIAEHLGPIDEVVRERQRDELIEEARRRRDERD